MKILKIVLIGLLLGGCSEGKFAGLSNQELEEKKRHCDSVKKKSPVFAAGCEGVKKEIEARKKKRKK